MLTSATCNHGDIHLFVLFTLFTVFDSEVTCNDDLSTSAGSIVHRIWEVTPSKANGMKFCETNRTLKPI